MLRHMTEPKDDFDAAFEDEQTGKKASGAGGAHPDLDSLSSSELFEDDVDDSELKGSTFLGRMKKSLRMAIVITAGVVLVAGAAYFFLVEGGAVSNKKITSTQNETSRAGSGNEARGKQSGLGVETAPGEGTPGEGAPGEGAPGEAVSSEGEEVLGVEESELPKLIPVKVFLRGVRIPRSRPVVWVDGVRLGGLKKKRRAIVVQEGEHVLRVVYNVKGERSQLSAPFSAQKGVATTVTINFRKKTIEQEGNKAR